MRERVVVTGLGVVAPIGATREAFFDGLDDGRSGIARSDNNGDGGDGIGLAARVADAGARRFVEPRALRRMARVTQLAVAAAHEALAQGALDGSFAKERCGIVLGTGLGSLRETMEFVTGFVRGGPEAASPMLFPSSVMNAAAGQLAIELGFRGTNTTINHREASPIDALMVARDLLVLGRADALLVGGVDELSPPSALGYRALGRLSPTGMRPYARDRDGSVAGEGAAILLLERESDARRRGARPLAAIAGAASSGSERPRVGWGRAWEGAARTIARALDEARLAPDAIDYVCGQGAGLPVDALEARAVVRAVGERAPIGSILGQVGDCMASGALRAAAAIYALERQRLPGTAGAGEPDPEAPLPNLVRDPRPQPVRAVLLPSLAQGGSDAALVLAAAD